MNCITVDISASENRPEHCHYSVQDYEHAVHRVRSMSMNELYARHKKMTISKKICAFYDALVAEQKCTGLRRQMERMHDYLTPTATSSGEEYETHTLVKGNSPDVIFTFQTDPQFGGVWVTDAHGEEERMEVSEARALWNRLVQNDGFVPA